MSSIERTEPLVPEATTPPPSLVIMQFCTGA
jgi:hypothetical protein